MKIGFIYAGQGSQVVSMGQSLYNTYPEIRDFYDQLQGDVDVKKLSFQGPLEELSLTYNTQPCMVAFAIAATKLLKQAGIKPDYTCGLSLGEYSALYCAGVLKDKQAVELVAYRGKAMQEAAKNVESLMIAIIGLEREKLEEACLQARHLGIVSIANYNCPGQLVIGGQKEAVEKASELALALGARRAIALNTSGPFHTALLENASLALHDQFQKETFCEMEIPVIFNASASPLPEGESIASMLEKQVMSPVYFEDSIRYMIDQGVDTFIEIGPGKVLSGFIRKIDKTLKTYQVEDVDSLNKVVEDLI